MKALAMALAIIVTLNCSAYCDRGVTASGEYVRDGICAADKVNGYLVPFGAKVVLPDGKVLVVKDRLGGGSMNNHLDIWMPREDDCWEFGRQMLKCKVEVAE